jgi:hypothetical protein
MVWIQFPISFFFVYKATWFSDNWIQKNELVESMFLAKTDIHTCCNLQIEEGLVCAKGKHYMSSFTVDHTSRWRYAV